MFISKKRHNAVVEAYEKEMAALELANEESQAALTTAMKAGAVALRRQQEAHLAVVGTYQRTLREYPPSELAS